MRIVPVGKQVKVSFVPSDLKTFTDGSNARNIVGKTSSLKSYPVKPVKVSYILNVSGRFEELGFFKYIIYQFCFEKYRHLLASNILS